MEDCGTLFQCVQGIIGHITDVIHPQIQQAINGPEGVSLIASKLNAFCGNRDVCRNDLIAKGKDKIKSVIAATLGGPTYNRLNSCFNIDLAATDYMRNKLCGTPHGNFQGNATGSPVQLCDNIGAWADTDWFSDCPNYADSCIDPFAGWTVPNNCMTGIYTRSKNWVEVRDETLSDQVTVTTFDLTEDAQIGIGTVCDGQYVIKFADRGSTSSACRGQIFVAMYETVTGGDIWTEEQGDSYVLKVSDPAPKKIYLQLLEQYDGQAAKINILKTLPKKIVAAYTTMVMDFVNNVLNEEFSKANQNSAIWIGKLRSALGILAGAGGNINYTLRQYLTLTIGNNLGGYEKNTCQNITNPRALELCYKARDLCGKIHSDIFSPPNGTYWKQVAAANDCIRPIMETLDPNCRVISTQYFTANDLENMGRSIDDNFTIADAQNLIKNQDDPYTQCSGVTKIISITKVDGQLAIQYEFKPSIAWNRGQLIVNYKDGNQTKSCDNGNIASLMGDLVKVLNETRLPSCGLSPLDRLLRTSQDLGRPIKRIGGIGPFCEYTWPNRADQNWGKDPNPDDETNNGPVNCAEYAMPNNCLGYPAIYNQEERFGFIEFLFLLAIVLPVLDIKNETDEASELFAQIKSKVAELLKSILENVEDIVGCDGYTFE